MRPLELWGGHECTVNRVGAVFHDQTIRSGHETRLDDLDRFAALGVKALRYPVIWERVAPHAPDQLDWAWTDARLERIRALGMKPVAGLVHHGSGPRYTSLVDEAFAPLLGQYARAAAERYPWIDDWTPVNEPLTTARFSALYGHWYPHLADEAMFWAALLNEVDGTRAAMAQIRQVNPRARLIQTEDIGRTYATAAAAAQAEFDNHRRWMSWDLLCGMVKPGHPLWERLVAFGLHDRLAAIADDPCPPDVIGLNHYLTSDRFLDHRTELYPPHRIGGNAYMAFADVEAIRVTLPAPGGLEGALEEVWARYGRPIVVTESHLGCTRDEQVRWVREAWDTAQRLRARGVQIEAVTAWALLGSFDWNSLLTRSHGHYESGAYDVRGGSPRPTAVAAELARIGLATGEAHPATQGPGWWRRDIRLEFQPAFRAVQTPEPRTEWRPTPAAPKPLLIVGATGTLGKALARACEWRGIAYVLSDRRALDLSNERGAAEALDRIEPWAVVNAAGWVRVDDAEASVEACLATNTEGAVRLAHAAAAKGLPFVGFSTDLVFDGRLSRPYVESDAPAPLNVYGRSKAEAERTILALDGSALMVRTAAFFSPFDPYNFAAHLARALAAGQPFEAASDLVISPTYVPDLADATLDLLIDGETGIRHLANEGEVTWAEFGRRLAFALDLDPELIRERAHGQFRWAARRPAYAVLGTERGQLMPTLEAAIQKHAALIRSAAFAPEVEALAEGARHDRPAPVRTRPQLT